MVSLGACLLVAMAPGASPPQQDLELIDLAGLDLPTVTVAPDVDPSSELLVHDQRDPTHLGAKVLFVNFDGADMQGCGNSPINNCSSIFQGNVLPFSGDNAKRASVIQSIRTRLAPYGFTVTDQRPQSGDYDMEMVGDWEGQDPSFAGIAPGGDCWDNGGGAVSFTLEKSGTIDGIAEIVLQEVGHTWGLAHVNEVQDLLFPTTQGVNKTFRDECYQIVADTDLNPTSDFCSHHGQACGSQSLQNSAAEILMIFGPATPDTSPPTVTITQPSDGASIEGGTFDIVLQLADNEIPAIIDTILTIDGPSLPAPQDVMAAWPSPDEITFPITGLPDGTFDITVDGTDEEGNAASDAITITVTGSETPPGASGEGGSGGGSGDGADGGSGDGDGGTGGGGASGGASSGGIPQSDEGCGCHATGPGAGWGLLLFAALGLRRRRR